MSRLQQLASISIVVLAAAACQDSAVTSPGDPNVRPSTQVMPNGTASFVVRGVSYGPNGEFVTPSSCASTYAFVQDSVGFWGNQEWVHVTSYKKFGCTIPDVNAGNNIVGGDVSYTPYSIANGTTGWVQADRSSYAELTNVPLDKSLKLRAVPWDGFYLMYWTVTRTNGSTYRVYTESLTRSATVDEVEYKAEFRAGTPPGDPGDPGDPPPNPCLDPTVPGCE